VRRACLWLVALTATACITPPERLYTPPIRYPDSLHAARIEGQVKLRVVVDTAGNVDSASVRVLSSTNARFEQPAREAVLASLYRPGRRAGRAVPVEVTVPVVFTLKPRAVATDRVPTHACLAAGRPAVEYFRVLARRYHPDALAAAPLGSRLLVGFVLDSACQVLRHGAGPSATDTVVAEEALADLFPGVDLAPRVAAGAADAAAPRAPGAVWVVWVVLGR
jgi:TonB family protein